MGYRSCLLDGLCTNAYNVCRTRVHDGYSHTDIGSSGIPAAFLTSQRDSVIFLVPDIGSWDMFVVTMASKFTGNRKGFL